MSRRTGIAAVAATVALLAGVAGCSGSGDASDATKSAASALATNTAVVAAENQLKQNFAKDWTVKHPYDSLKVVLRETFPGAHTSDIVNYGVKTFKFKDRKPGPDQEAWFSGVVVFALQQSATGVHGTPSIPGATAPATAKSSSS